MWIKTSVPDQSGELGVLDGDSGSISPQDILQQVISDCCSDCTIRVL